MKYFVIVTVCVGWKIKCFRSPINFNPEANEVALESNYAEEYKQLQSEQIAIFEEKKALVSEYTPNADAAYLKELETLNKRDRENREAACIPQRS